MAEETVENGGDENALPVEANFLQFISGMAGQVLIHLGEIPNPLTGKREKDLVNAKYSVDLLAIIEEKTKGNLTDEEKHYIETALYDLRMRFIKASDETKSEDDAEPAAENN